jgi:hypothetical protein
VGLLAVHAVRAEKNNKPKAASVQIRHDRG